MAWEARLGAELELLKSGEARYEACLAPVMARAVQQRAPAAAAAASNSSSKAQSVKMEAELTEGLLHCARESLRELRAAEARLLVR